MADLITVLFVVTLIFGVIRWGSGPEKVGGQILLFVVGFGVLRSLLVDGPIDDFDVFGLLSDCLAFLGFTWIAIFSWRFWPIWTAALQLLAIGAHFGPALHLPVDPVVYAIMRTAPTTVAMFTLIMVTFLQRRKPRLVGSKQHWRTWSGPLNRISPKRWPSAFSPNTGR